MIATDTPVRNEFEMQRAPKAKKPGADAKKVKALTKKLIVDKGRDDSDISDASMSIHSDNSVEDWAEESENEETVLIPKPTDKPSLTRNPVEGDYVLVRFLSQQGKKGKGKANPLFYVGKIIKEVDDEGDCVVTFARASGVSVRSPCQLYQT